MTRWGSAVLVFLVLMVAPVLAQKAGKGAPADRWTTYTSSLGRFVVEVPGSASEETMPGPKGRPTTHVMRCRDRDNAYVVMFMDLQSPNPSLDTICEQQQKAMESTGKHVMGTRPANVSGFAAREFQITSPRESGRVLIFIWGDRLYWAWVFGHNPPDDRDIDRFFGSLELR